MLTTSDKVKESIHDAAEKVEDVRTTSVRRSRTPRTTLPKSPRMLRTMSA